MTLFEQAVLQILADSPDALGWYQIERRLSNIRIQERPKLPDVLNHLCVLNLIDEINFPTTPIHRYKITNIGRDSLSSKIL